MADGSMVSSNGKSAKKPRIAYAGEEFGFGRQALQEFVDRCRDDRYLPDGGQWALHGRLEREFVVAPLKSNYDFQKAQEQPLRLKEQALIAVKSKTADFAIVPFYHPYSGYDFETLRALSSLFTLLAVDQIEASDHFCLAVYEPQVLDLVQAAHPGSGLSMLLKKQRTTWGAAVDGGANVGAFARATERETAGLNIDASSQLMLRDRIDLVFAGPEAARRCKSKLDGLRAAGVKVEETVQWIEPHREMGRRVRDTLDRGRQTSTFFDPRDGKTHFVSTMSSEAQSRPLYGVVLPFDVAARSAEFTIIEPNIDDAEPTKTRFFVVRETPDATLYEDAYRTTDAKTRYWNRRLDAVADARSDLSTRTGNLSGAILVAAGLTLMFFGAVGATDLTSAFLTDEISKWLTPAVARSAIAVGALLALVGWPFIAMRAAGARGVRMMMRFRRDGDAASIGDVENFLRNFGVRHAVTRMDEDSERDAPASMILDIEFEPGDFAYGLGSVITRRVRGSVVNGALKVAFSRWKSRGVTILAAMPIEEGKMQLPRHARRRWWNEALSAWFADVAETWFIRLSRILVIPLVGGLALLIAALALGWRP